MIVSDRNFRSEIPCELNVQLKLFSLDQLMIQIFRISTISKCLRALGKIIPKESERQLLTSWANCLVQPVR